MSLIFSRQLQAAARGGLGGLAATVPMTAAMMAMHEQLPWWQKQPLPPRQITKELVAKAAHVVWGAALGWVHAALTTESECTRDSSSERCRLSGRK